MEKELDIINRKFWAKHHENVLLKDKIQKLESQVSTKSLFSYFDKIVTGKICYLNNEKKFGRILHGDTKYYFSKNDTQIPFENITENKEYKFKIIKAKDPRYNRQAFIIEEEVPKMYTNINCDFTKKLVIDEEKTKETKISLGDLVSRSDLITKYFIVIGITYTTVHLNLLQYKKVNDEYFFKKTNKNVIYPLVNNTFTVYKY